MKRREFLGCVAGVSAAAYAGEASAKATDSEQETPAVKIKITAVKKVIFQDLYVKYTGKEGTICSAFEEGQEFTITSPYRPPEGFCSWAWADIRPAIHAAYFGSREDAVVCCSDGYRPVMFHVKRM